MIINDKQKIWEKDKNNYSFCYNSTMEVYSIADIHGLMREGKLTAEMLVKQYLDRIDEIDINGPALNSIIELNPDALSIARELDGKFKENGLTGPLHGIPIVIKDNIDTADQMKTTAGSLSIEIHGGKPSKDAFIVTQLRNAGAIIVAKTNLSEMANFRGQRSISGWSSRGGRTRNPHVLDRNTSGSSSGTGAAISANLATIGIGTETDGSIISPSSINGIVGIKPSIGLVSRSGIIPIAHTQDTAGPMTRSVTDAALLLETIVGYDPDDKVTEVVQGIETNYTSALQSDGLKGARLGVVRKNFGFHKDVDDVLNKALKVLEDQGAELVDPIEFEYPEEWGQQEFTVLLYEYKFGLNKYFNSRADSDIKNIDDLIRFNEENAERTMPYFGQEHVIAASEKPGLDDEVYLDAMKKYEEFRANFNKMLKENNLDAIVAPSNGPAWVTDFVNGDNYGGGSSQFAAVTGFCNITVPAGTVHHLPVGLNFIAGQYQEKTIIKLAYAFEQATKSRPTPMFVKSIENM